MNFNPNPNANKPAVNFGIPAAESTPASSGLNLGNVGAPGASAGLQLKPAATTPAIPFGSSPLTAGSTSTTGFAAPSFTSTAAPSFTSTAAPTLAGFSMPATTTSAATGFPLTGATTSAPAGFSLTGATTSAPTGFPLTGATTSTSLGFPPNTATTISSSLTSGLLLGGATTSAPSSTGTSFAMPLNFGLSSTSTAATTSTTTSTASAAAAGGSVSNLNFGQLEETINKWTMDLEEQEKLFMNQATQVNAWDHLLTANGEKIVQLNEAVEAVKVEQQQIDHELGFILAQQTELEDCLVPLEKELASTAVLDPEREHTYELAEAMDTQLKQMSEDLREIIEYLNENNRSQDSSDPLVQIGRILNAHMNSLQWIDQNTNVIQNHLDQVVKLQESHRRDNERSFHVSYN